MPAVTSEFAKSSLYNPQPNTRSGRPANGGEIVCEVYADVITREQFCLLGTQRRAATWPPELFYPCEKK
jgi:hypothetical protein